MKIKPIHLLPVLLIFVVSLAWSNYSSTKAQWRDSYSKLDKCRVLGQSIQQLRDDANSTIRVSNDKFDYQAAIAEKLSKANISTPTAPTPPTNIDSRSQLKIGRFQFETNWSEISLRELVQLLASTTAPNNEIFAQKIQLVAPPKNSSKSLEKWQAKIVWNYFQAE